MGDADKQWLEKYQPIGVEACKTDFTPEQLKLAKAAEKQGMQRIIELAPKVTDARQILGTRDTLGDTPREVFAEALTLANGAYHLLKRLTARRILIPKGKSWMARSMTT